MVEPTSSILKNTISRHLTQCKNIQQLKKLHAHIIKSPYLTKNDRYTLTNHLLFKCALSSPSSLLYATKIFNNLQSLNLYAYNVLIRAYSSKINCGKSPNYSCLNLYVQMLRNGISPNNLTFPFVLKECTKRVDGFRGMGVISHVLRMGFCNDVYIGNCMISLFCECGLLDDARKVFDEMLERDVVSWNSIIVGCLRNGDLGLALGLFRRMEMRSIYTWNSMITGFVQGGQPKVALELFQEMQMVEDGGLVKPDKITIASFLSACASLGAVDHGNWVHGYLKRSEVECDMVIATALIDMYGKCGHVDVASMIFREMPKKDVMAWTAMISVYALHGLGKDALSLLKEMDLHGVNPNHVTFVGILSACAHAGLVDEGRQCFDMMTNIYSIEPHVYHYACMIDILSRASLFDEAEDLISTMPVEPDVYVWGALLGGCQMHNNVQLGEKVALRLIDLDPQNHAFYINLCDIYAKAGRFNDVKKIRAIMLEKGIEKDSPGSSMIEVDGVVHEFSIRGSPELVMEEIIQLLNELHGEMKIGSRVNDVGDAS